MRMILLALSVLCLLVGMIFLGAFAGMGSNLAAVLAFVLCTLSFVCAYLYRGRI